ncbi:hypothetical protein OB69_06935 [Roseivirga seohaensis subsp. aquiponti]|uniref:Pycsar effector protein domain-containing protein n=1 Tax=Roseivirga seohaensis subsp. aquiponti TaxID=1566026 RepID=A0A0L8AKW5_9BACT|nr:Pycsar system effector family protein [Roseivirga seohaensis]KOF03068.1 hypothetical protein OB69_06935 [Roseivirga seohaensis subsp. aquiponti]
MSLKSDTDNITQQLYQVFNNVNDWLKFAEAKNAMLIAFNGASIFGIIKLLSLDFVSNSRFIENYLLFVIISLIFSTVNCLISFAPRVKIIKGGFYDSGKVPNVLFFEYLKGKNNLEIIEEVTGDRDKENYTTLQKDIAEQIKQNSIIASRKYSHFTISVWITISAYITVILAGIFCLYTYLNE